MKGINEEGYLIIEDRIYTIRGMQVMIDRDIAALYGVETKRLNEQVRRNINQCQYQNYENLYSVEKTTII